MCCDVTVVFDLTFFNEVTKSDNILKNIEANVIDSCIEVIIGMPDIRSHRLVHCIPSYFDSIDPTYLVPPQGTSQSSTPSTVASLVRRDTLRMMMTLIGNIILSTWIPSTTLLRLPNN